jgi:hypothetical protein
MLPSVATEKSFFRSSIITASLKIAVNASAISTYFSLASLVFWYGTAGNAWRILTFRKAQPASVPFSFSACGSIFGNTLSFLINSMAVASSCSMLFKSEELISLSYIAISLREPCTRFPASLNCRFSCFFCKAFSTSSSIPPSSGNRLVLNSILRPLLIVPSWF